MVYINVYALKLAMIKAGIGFKDLCRCAGISSRTISRMTKDGTTPRVKIGIVAKVVKVLKIDPDTIIAIKEM